MIDNDQASEIDNILRTVSEPSLTDTELNLLNADGAEIVHEPCDYYKYALEVLEARHKYDQCPTTSIENLIRIASGKGCNLQQNSSNEDFLMPFFAAGITSCCCR